jgi:hypothetical protein
MQFLHRTDLEYAQSIGNTFQPISGGGFEYFPVSAFEQYKFWAKYEVQTEKNGK